MGDRWQRLDRHWGHIDPVVRDAVAMDEAGTCRCHCRGRRCAPWLRPIITSTIQKRRGRRIFRRRHTGQDGCGWPLQRVREGGLGVGGSAVPHVSLCGRSPERRLHFIPLPYPPLTRLQHPLTGARAAVGAAANGHRPPAAPGDNHRDDNDAGRANTPHGPSENRGSGRSSAVERPRGCWPPQPAPNTAADVPARPGSERVCDVNRGLGPTNPTSNIAVEPVEVSDR